MDHGLANRRAWLRQAVAAATLTVPARAWSRAPHDHYPFALGVASGSPTHESVVLWTRLVGDGLLSSELGGAPRQVRWELAGDSAFASVLRSGTSVAVALLAHAVHVELHGLQPAREYWYRFFSGDAVSEVGRTRTLPAPDSAPRQLRFAFASCQRWEQGRFAAWRHLLADDPELVVFPGDYIYEYPALQGPVRPHSLTPAWTLSDYRQRYAMYKSDPNLRRIHAACPWLITWDDHEVQNDYARDRSEDLAPDFLMRRTAAYQAFYEHMPLPASVLRAGLAGLSGAGGTGRPEAVRVRQRFQVGQLATLHLLDTRQYRDWQACPRPGRGGQNRVTAADCAELNDPQRSLLGGAQEQWLAEGLAHDQSARRGWSILAQTTMFAPRDLRGGAGRTWWTDGWDGYPAARQRLLDQLVRRPPRNTVFIGGDLHQNWVSRVHADPLRIDTPVVASDFCGTSISSRSAMTQQQVELLLRENPHALLANSERRGYQLVELTARRWTSTLRVLDDVTREDSGASTLARFVVEDGRPGPQQD